MITSKLLKMNTQLPLSIEYACNLNSKLKQKNKIKTVVNFPSENATGILELTLIIHGY